MVVWIKLAVLVITMFACLAIVAVLSKMARATRQFRKELIDHQRRMT